MESQLQFWQWIKSGDLDHLADYLTSHPQAVDEQTPEGISAVMFALYYGQNQVADLLIQREARLDVFSAAASGQLGVLKQLVDDSSQMANQYSSDGFPLLGLACFFGQYDCAAYLIAMGANVNAVAQNSQRVTALHAAAAANSVDLVRLLLEHSASVDALQQGEFTALHAAGQNGNLEMVKLLLQYHADLNRRTAEGKTAVDYAREAGHPQIAEYLENAT